MQYFMYSCATALLIQPSRLFYLWNMKAPTLYWPVFPLYVQYVLIILQVVQINASAHCDKCVNMHHVMNYLYTPLVIENMKV